ncbi:nucleotide-diphospho-sugar transferase [Gloeophyllum trabeum ATCC 11539]|uniref:Nucleotide-diphospho-sugar transferase n=1 Tax=Gloeophyllum trabeum (strain ATCC 11539 / FP-39264 / Madison 617) TaxID=670483 RepID=S7RXR0_GLOTA|nr:nucleotide-diphospho-sugar transferase [Gloeophyllum trabeum ATCC 11539]EPQ59720.1 nucleotide-diphospho-sugar transferase [Gloeophyllum trabeum ATCC 11539]
MGDDYIFTQSQDWFSFNIDIWKALFPLVKPSPRILEIGSWEGRSAVFLLNELCADGGEVVCIDHFDLMATEAGKARYRKLVHNLTLTGKKFQIIDEFSVPGLMRVLDEHIRSKSTGFDWVYVDGSHEADDTLLDGELAWRLANDGAIFIFDDYQWDVELVGSIHHPKRGIDAFLALHDGEYQRLSSPSQYQMILQKKVDMRIGFLLKDPSVNVDDRALGYGMNVALTIDECYAMPAAVAVKGLVNHSNGKLTIYIVDCGLSVKSRNRIASAAKATAEASVVFVELPKDNFSTKRGAVWAKLDMLRVLPVERVLYLDADTLVRKTLVELWRTDLEGRSLAAVPDIGLPMGHPGVERRPYFNAGVMLVDLSKVRIRITELCALADEMRHARFKDQDVLNMHLGGDWKKLSLTWNAQGLGTYADLPSNDRDAIALDELRDPAIVHFTGPLHPDLPTVLNPWVQPYTAKPWGYAGSPGHPFEAEWWETLDETAWKGYRQSSEYKAMVASEKSKAIAAAVLALEDRFTGQ